MATLSRALRGASALFFWFLACAPGSEPGATAPPAKTLKSLPADFPALNMEREMPTNASGEESDFVLLEYGNYKLLDQLSAYSPESISAEFGRRMEKETDIHVKLFLAAVAARYGNVPARKFIHDLARNTNYVLTRNRGYALHYLLRQPQPAAWVFDEVHETLGDTRETSGGRFEEIARAADEDGMLLDDLGKVKNPKSVPVLIEVVKHYRDGNAIRALGKIGDARAIPICLELLRDEVTSIKLLTRKHAQTPNSPSNAIVAALGDLKAKEAVPILLNYLISAEVIRSLGVLGDERAIKPLKIIVTNHGRMKDDPENHAGGVQTREFAARMALIKLEKDDPIPKWIAVMEDQSLDWPERREAVWELGNHPDARAIPHLVAAVKSDSAGEVVNPCVTVLSLYKYKAAVEGLIKCFDANFDGKTDWKRANSPEAFYENINKSLRTLTGQDFGPDKARWLKWWQEEGSHLENLK